MPLSRLETKLIHESGSRTASLPSDPLRRLLSRAVIPVQIFLYVAHHVDEKDLHHHSFPTRASVASSPDAIPQRVLWRSSRTETVTAARLAKKVTENRSDDTVDK